MCRTAAQELAEAERLLREGGSIKKIERHMKLREAKIERDNRRAARQGKGRVD